MTGEAQAKLPRLREDLRLLKGAPTVTGKPTWLIFDPVSYRYYQIDGQSHELLSMWNEASTVAAMVAVYEQRLGESASEQRIIELATFVEQHNLSIEPAENGWQHYHTAYQRRRHEWWRTAVHSYLFFRIPLFRPHRFLARTLSVAAPFLTRSFLVLALIAGIVGIYLTSRQWDEFVGSFAGFFSLGGICAYLAALAAIKVVHELAHAYTATKFGCRVPTMGVAFLVMFPVLYTDATDAWKLRSRRQRLLISGAGILAELSIAAFATFLWAFLPDGPAKSICFVLATTSWIMSLAINLNPFMRFDGYYLASDAVAVENLQPRSFALGRWKLREWLFGLGHDCPEVLPAGTRTMLVAYAWGTWIYRLFLFIGIALLVYFLFFKVLGVILFIVEIIWFVARPVWDELKEWYKMRDEIFAGRRIIGTSALAIGLIALGLMPLSTSVEIPAVAEAKQFERIFPVVPARVERVHVHNGQSVTKGDLLIELSAPDLTNRLELNSLKLAASRYRLERASGDRLDKEQILVLQRELAHLEEERAGLERQIEQLAVTAPFDGRVVDLQPQLHVARWIGRREPVFSVASDGARLARGYLAERDLWRLEAGAAGRFVPDDISQSSLGAGVESIASSNSVKLELAYLASTHGGPISVEGENADELVPSAAQYLVTLRLDDSDEETRPVQRGIVRVRGKPESLFSGLWRQTLKVLVRESGV